MSPLGVDLVEFVAQRTCVHHALMVSHILGVGCHINHYRVILWQAGFEVGFLPLVFFVLVALMHIFGCKPVLRSIIARGSPGEPEELQVHALNEVEVSIYKGSVVQLTYSWGVRKWFQDGFCQ